MATSRSNKIKRIAKKSGMAVSGNFLIGLHNDDVVSGLAIDSPPSSTYLWIFILPTYDSLKFLHMTLGDRVASCDGGDEVDSCFTDALNKYRSIFSKITSASDIYAYLDSRGSSGDYSNWVKYLSLIRVGDFASAENFLSASPMLSTWSIAVPKIQKIEAAKAAGGWTEVQRLLTEWSSATSALVRGKNR